MERVTQGSIEPVQGRHYWALLEGKTVVVFCGTDGDLYVAGAWEYGVDVDRLVAEIPVPEEIEGVKNYYG